MRRRSFALAGGALAAAPWTVAGTAAARQIGYGRTRSGSDTWYRIRWLDHAQQERDITFPVPTTEIEAGARIFRQFSMDDMRQRIEAAMRETASKWTSTTLVIDKRTQANPNALTISYQLRGSSGEGLVEARRQIDATIDAARVRYASGYLRRIDGQILSVDYQAAARRYVAVMTPLARALAQAAGGLDERGRVALALSLFQAIPYDELSDRVRNGGTDFAPPPVLFEINRGDCDSKSLALGCVLRALVPSRAVAMATMPGHAILAVDVPAVSGDAWMRGGGRVYVAMEAAGPAMAPPGRVAPRTAPYLDRASFTLWPLGG